MSFSYTPSNFHVAALQTSKQYIHFFKNKEYLYQSILHIYAKYGLVHRIS